MGKAPPLYPLRFRPILKERLWGGRNLERLYRKALPATVPIGESWEISDRPGDVSIIDQGPLAGQTLRWLMEHHPTALLGSAPSPPGRFPLLIKVLDAEAKLSLQVHPPAGRAAALGGEPKTELWYVAEARPGAELFVGLRRGTTRAEFERRIRDGNVAKCFHRIKVKSGDAMFLPSGRVHALGAGNVIFEVQQNSDTTYRVFDWNRVGTDGRSRELHVEQSLACIDFEDFEPDLVHQVWRAENAIETTRLLEDPLFTVELVRAVGTAVRQIRGGVATILGVVRGAVRVKGGGHDLALAAGEFGLLPAALADAAVEVSPDTEFLQIVPG